MLTAKPVAKEGHSFAATNVTTAAYVTVVAATSQPCSFLEIFNGGGSILKLAIGAVGSEVDMPFYITPGSSSFLVPIEIPKNVRLSLKAVDANSTTGYIILNFFA